MWGPSQDFSSGLQTQYKHHTCWLSHRQLKFNTFKKELLNLSFNPVPAQGVLISVTDMDLHPVAQAQTRASFLIPPFPSLTMSKDLDQLILLPKYLSYPSAPPACITTLVQATIISGLDCCCHLRDGSP